MGRRKENRNAMKAGWKAAKLNRDAQALKRIAKGPTAGQKLAAKMAAK